MSATERLPLFWTWRDDPPPGYLNDPTRPHGLRWAVEERTCTYAVQRSTGHWYSITEALRFNWIQRSAPIEPVEKPHG